MLFWKKYLSSTRAAHRSSGSSLGSDAAEKADEEKEDGADASPLGVARFFDLLTLLLPPVALVSANTTSAVSEPTAALRRSAVSSDRRATDEARGWSDEPTMGST